MWNCRCSTSWGWFICPAQGKEKTLACCFFTHILRNFQTICAEKEKFPHGFPQGLVKIQVLHDLDGDYEFFLSYQQSTEDQNGSPKDKVV